MGLTSRWLAFVAFVIFSQSVIPQGLANEQSEITLDSSQNTLTENLFSPISSAFQMFIALGCVIALAYLVLHKGLGLILKRQRLGEIIKVRERLVLDGKNTLFVVEIDGQSLLLATGEKGVQVVLPSLQANRGSIEKENRTSFAAIQSNAITGA